MWVLFLARKRELALGVTHELSFMPVLLMIIASLRASLVEEVIKAHNIHCQELRHVNLSVTSIQPMSESPLTPRRRKLQGKRKEKKKKRKKENKGGSRNKR